VTRNIRVLVVDDSAFMRRNLPRLLETDPDIHVVGTAADGEEGLRLVKSLHPDVVTLDVQMPVMDGLTALRRIMDEAPTPVVMVSSTTGEGTAETIEALSLGAVDFVQKPGTSGLPSGELAAKVKAAYLITIRRAASIDVTRDKFRALREQLMAAKPQQGAEARGGSAHAAASRVVAIAASTGGPAALQVLLARLPADLPAGVVIVQHIAAGFTRPLAQMLDRVCALDVREARGRERVAAGEVLLCPGEQHLTVQNRAGELYALVSPEPADTLYRPSADVLFESIAACCAPDACAVILTGMGDDGARGMLAIREHGGQTIAQDESTSLIFGMGRRAIEMGGVAVVRPLEDIAEEIVRACASVPGRAGS
jgi:two-component system chemotaxis response regulator CheB